MAFKNTTSICEIVEHYKKSANEKCLLGDVFVVTYGSYLWLC